MGQLANTPTWGFLVKAPVEQVRETLASFGEEFIFRTNNGWTAAFYMEPGDGRDREAAERLRSLGLVPIYWFDFNKYEFLTLRWDGERWGEDEDPDIVLTQVGLQAPYWDGPAPKGQPLETRKGSRDRGCVRRAGTHDCRRSMAYRTGIEGRDRLRAGWRCARCSHRDHVQ